MSEGPDRAQLARDLIIFEIKLIVDSMRDLLLSPIAFVAGLLGLISPRAAARRYFYDVVRFGRRTEHWIDPFSVGSDAETPEGSLGDMLSRAERQLREQYARSNAGSTARRSGDPTPPGSGANDKTDEERTPEA